MAETRNDAEASFDAFIETYELKYEKAADCLKKDRNALLAYYDFPAEHWKHLRTSNPIQSTFAYGAAQDDPLEGPPLEQDRARHGLQSECGGDRREPGTRLDGR